MLKPMPYPRVARPLWSQPNIQCQGCATVEAHDRAAQAHWYYAPTREAFNAYYCPDCASVYRHDRDTAAQAAANDI